MDKITIFLFIEAMFVCKQKVDSLFTELVKLYTESIP